MRRENRRFVGSSGPEASVFGVPLLGISYRHMRDTAVDE